MSKSARADQWAPLPCVPDAVGDPDMHHRDLGFPVGKWTYRDKENRRVGYTARYDTDNGGKEFRPTSWCKNRETGKEDFRWKAPLEPRPLYGQEILARRPRDPMMVHEGEKCADVSRRVIPDYVGVSPMNGAKSPEKSDWSLAAGRDAIVFPDNDRPGEEFAQKVAHILHGLGCRVRIVDVKALVEKAIAGRGSAVNPDGLDIADAECVWESREALRDVILSLAIPFVPELKPKPDDNIDELILPSPGNPMRVAREFVNRYCLHQGTLILRYWRDSWWKWETTCWQEVERRLIVSDLYTFTEHAIYFDDKGEVKPWAPNRHKIGDLTEALGSVCFLPEEIDQPCWLEGNPSNGVIVACANGLLEIDSRRLLPHSPLFFNQVAVPFPYDPNAPEPAEWLKFLMKLWPGDNPDAELSSDQPEIKVLGEWFGYIISGLLHLHKILLMVTPTRGGKGIIARILAALMGSDNVIGPTLSSLGNDFGLMPLIGKPLAIVGDARFVGRNIGVVVERLLSISGQDVITVPRKYREDWNGTLPTRLHILSNLMPEFKDASAAIIGRLVILTQPQSWLGREDFEIEERVRKELSGILNWALAGLRRLINDNENRFTTVPGAEESIAQMRDLASPIGTFVRDRCVLRQDALIEVDELYKLYRSWADENGHTKSAKSVFGRDLHARFPSIRRGQTQKGKSRVPVYHGICLKPETSENDDLPPEDFDEYPEP